MKEINKIIIIVSIINFLLLICNLANCQTSISRYKYEGTLYAGALVTIANRTPKNETSVSPVKFIRPVTKTLGFAFDINLSNKYFLGLEGFYDEFDYGYEAAPRSSQNSGIGIASGLLGAADRIALYKSGIRIGYKLLLNDRIELNTIIVPSVSYSKYSNRLADTLKNNKSVWEGVWGVDILYINLPPTQNTGIKFVLKGTAEIVYKIKNQFALSLSMSYQQGFATFIHDKVKIIRPFDAKGYQEAIYSTALKGNSLQWHFGVRYKF